jgi:hypothetical protein
MKWFKRKGADYGRIQDVSVAWEFAHEEEAEHLEKAREWRAKRVEIENLHWQAVLLDDTMGTEFDEYKFDPLPPKLTKYQEQLRTEKKKENALLLGMYYVVPKNDFELNVPKRCLTFVRKLNFSVMERCVLEFGHAGDHSLGEGVRMEPIRKVDPIIVHELVGEIHGKEEFERLKSTLEDLDKESERARKRSRKQKLAEIQRLGRFFE